MMTWLLKKLFSPFPRVVRWYLSKKRIYRYNKLIIEVHPGVFHPGLFSSTKMLLEFISRQSLKDQRVLELGAGTGIISLKAALLGAVVFSTDISKKAIENIRRNAQINNLAINIIESDLFQKIPETPFDWIVINPPYYPKEPSSEEDYAWYCGAHHEYYIRLFNEMTPYLTTDTHIIMILSDVCDLKTIFRIAAEHNFEFIRREEKKVWMDGNNYIFQIKPIA